MKVTPIASTVSDNWFYAIEHEGDMLLIDPIDAQKAIDYVQQHTPTRVRIFSTHGHPDHIGGNDEVVRAIGAQVIASGHSDIFDTPADTRVVDGDVIAVGQTMWNVYHAPGHTNGHLVLHHPGHLISGDVYFAGGIGHCRFGGDPTELYRTVTERLAHLPNDTTFYPGHDYTVRNLEFCLEVDPSNTSATVFKEKAEAFYGANPRRAPFLLTLGEERAYNPFHRVKNAAVQQTVHAQLAGFWPEDVDNPAEAAFRALRARRDRF